MERDPFDCTAPCGCAYRLVDWGTPGEPHRRGRVVPCPVYSSRRCQRHQATPVRELAVRIASPNLFADELVR